MLALVPPKFDSCHALDVEQVVDVSSLKAMVNTHVSQRQERYCPFFIVLKGGIRLVRYVAFDKDGAALVRTALNPFPMRLSFEEIADSPILGVYIRQGRLFYDPHEMEVSQMAVIGLKAMQRLS